MNFLFGDNHLDVERRELRRGAELIAVEPQVFDLLLYLIQNRDRVVSKDDLVASIWQGRIVSESTISSHIHAARKAIGDSGGAQRLIRTMPRRGVRFIGAAKEVTKGVPSNDTEDPARPLQVETDKPLIAVLPFANPSGDPEQDCVAYGIGEDIITALPRYRSLFVVVRSSSFAYKGYAVDLRQVWRELRVRYVLQGSVRKADNRVRITAQLIEAATGKHLWAERYDRDLADIFSLQDDVAEAVTIAVAPVIAAAERQRAIRMPSGNLDAWAAYQRGLWHFYKISPEDNALAQKYFQQAIGLEPNFGAGYKGMAWAQIQAAAVLAAGTPAEAYASAEALARRAVALDPTDAEARSSLSEAKLWSTGDYEGALAEAEQARAMCPNLTFAHATLGAALIFSGRPKQGLASIRVSLRLDPQDPMLPNRLNTLALGLYLSGEYGTAVTIARRAIRANPDYALNYRWLAASLGQLGQPAEANAVLERAITLSPASFDMYLRRVPWHRPEDHAHMLQGLRKAGWKA